MTVPLPLPANDGWTKAMNRTLYTTSISPCCRLMYLIVQSFTRDDDPWCTVQHATLSRAYGASERQVQRLLEELLSNGWLIEQPFGHGRAKAYLPIAGLSPTEVANRRHLRPGRRRSAFPTELSPKPPAPPSYPTEMSGKTPDPAPPNPTLPAALPDISVTANPTQMSPPFNEDRVKTPDKTVAPQPEPAPPPPVMVEATTPPPAPSPQPPLLEDRSTPPSRPPARPSASPRRSTALPADVAATVVEIWSYYKAKIQPLARVYDAHKIAKRLQLFSLAEIKLGIDHFAADPWWMEHNANQGADWFFRSDEQVQRWLTMVPRTAADRGGRRLIPGRDVGAPRTGYSGSPNGPDDPALREIFERDFR